MYDNGVRVLLLRFSKTRILFIFFVYISIHISANMSPFELKFSLMILHTKTSKLMYNWSFLFVVLHKPTLLPSTFKLENNWSPPPPPPPNSAESLGPIALHFE